MNRRIVFRYLIWWLIAAAELALAAVPAAQGQSAKLEPEANWGFPAQGFQISVAFTKPDFDAQEAVEAVILTRNVSDQSRSYFSSGAQFLQFLVVDEVGRRVPTRSELRSTPFEGRLAKIINNPKRITLSPAEKFEEHINLREYFDLPPGRYSVSATRRIPMINDPFAHSEVQSGTATVAIRMQNAGIASSVELNSERQNSSNGTAVVHTRPPQSEIVSQGDEVEAPLRTEAESHLVSKGDVTGVPTIPALVPWHEGKLVYAFGILTLGTIIGLVVWRWRPKEPQR